MENSLLDYDEIVKENDYRNHLAPKWKRFVNSIPSILLPLH